MYLLLGRKRISMAIKNIIFDIGNVLVSFAWKEFYESFGYSEDVLKRLINATVKDPAWNEFDRGVYSEEEVLQIFIKNDPEIEPQIRESLNNIEGMIGKYDYAIPWVQELKEKGYKVYYLSNFSSKAYRECIDTLGFLPYMDDGIMSYREKMIKPQPEIYQLLLSRFNLNAEECVFLDDTAVNIEAAEKQGIHGIVFKTREQAIEELKALGVN